MAKKDFLKSLIGKDLKGFSVQELFELYKGNDDGRKIETIGVFEDEKLAKAFGRTQVDANWHKVDKKLVLTNGKTAHLIDGLEEVPIIEKEQAKSVIKKHAAKKLSAEEAEVLGLK